jgi:hypothetical protein
MNRRTGQLRTNCTAADQSTVGVKDGARLATVDAGLHSCIREFFVHARGGLGDPDSLAPSSTLIAAGTGD